MRTKILLMVIGIAMVAVGIWVAALAPSQLNEGNQCTVNGGCRNVTVSISYVGPGAALAAVGIGVILYGYRKGKEAA